MGDILIICEQSDGGIKKYSKELAYKTSELASDLNCELQALVFGSSAGEDAGSLGAFGVNKVTVLSGETYEEYNSDIFAGAVEEIIREVNPSYVFASASVIGGDLLPRLATRFNAGMATECIEMTVENGEVIFRRPVYAGKAWADVKINSGIKFATARPNVFAIGEAKSTMVKVSKKEIAPVSSRVMLKEKVTSETKQIDLVEANVIVSGGRAMGSADNYAILRDLAALMNASVGASRAAVDAGYISHDHQVGQTGKTVNPTIYIACGISGAIQHLAGMRTSKYIIAINKDPEAPIFSKADFGIVGDLFKVVPVLTEKLKKVLSE